LIYLMGALPGKPDRLSSPSAADSSVGSLLQVIVTTSAC
jgi:hypothetical protein